MSAAVLGHAERSYSGVVEEAEKGCVDAAIRRLNCLANGFGTRSAYSEALAEFVRRAAAGCDSARSALLACAELLDGDPSAMAGGEPDKARFDAIAARMIAAREAVRTVREFDVEALASRRYVASEDSDDLFAIDAGYLDSIDPDGDPGAPVLYILSADPLIGYLRRQLPASRCERFWQLQPVDWNAATVYNDEAGNRIDLDHRDANVNVVKPIDFDLATGLVMHGLTAAVSSEVSYLEALQFVEYGPEQRFGYHHDYFSQAHVTSEAGQAIGGQRVTSFIFYLNDAYSGGETAFPDLGFKVRGSAGDVLLFKNVILDKYADVRTRHGSIAVKTGLKRVMVAWTRQHSWTPSAG